MKTKSPTPKATADAGGKAEPAGQSERFMAKARELGLDEREETFDAALTKVARHRVDYAVEFRLREDDATTHADVGPFGNLDEAVRAAAHKLTTCADVWICAGRDGRVLGREQIKQLSARLGIDW